MSGASHPGSDRESAQGGVEFEHWAFISYSREDNLPTRGVDAPRRCVLWAEWLQEALENYRVPKDIVGARNRFGEVIPERPFPIFRDEKDMGASGSLTDSIERGLDRSRCLIIICSPRAARSSWVNEEVRHFKHLGRAQRILPLIVAGEPGASIGDKVRAPASEECFVPALLHPLNAAGEIDLTKTDDMPLAADMRWGEAKREILAPDWKEASVTVDRAKLHLLSGILGVDLDDLIQRDRVRQLAEAKAKTRRARRLALGFAGLAVLAAGAAFFAMRQRNLAEQRREEVVRQEKATKAELSQSEYLRPSGLIASGDADQALLSLAKALEENPANREAMTRLTNLLGQRAWPYRVATLRHGLGVHFLKTDPKGEWLFVGGDRGNIPEKPNALQVWNLATLRLKAMSSLNWYNNFYQFDLDRTGSRILALMGHVKADSAELYDARAATPLTKSGDDDAMARKTIFSADGQYAIIRFERPFELRVFNASNGELRARITLTEEMARGLLAADVFGEEIRTVDETGTYAAWSMDGRPRGLRRLDTAETKEEASPKIDSAWFAMGGNQIYGAFGNMLGRWSTKTAAHVFREVGELEGAKKGSTEFRVEEKWLIVTGETAEGATPARFALRLPEKLDQPDTKFPAWRGAFSPISVLRNGGLAVGDGDKAMLVPFSGGFFSGPLRHVGRIVSLCELQDGLATGASDGELKLWHFAKPALSPTVSAAIAKPALQSAAESPNSESLDLLEDARGKVELRRIQKNEEEGFKLIIREVSTDRRNEVPWQERGQSQLLTSELSPDERTGLFTACSGTSSGRGDFGACLFSTEDGRLLSPLLDHPQCEGAHFTGDGSRVYTVGGGQVIFWDTTTYRRTGLVLSQPQLNFAVMVPGEKQMVTASDDGQVTLWDLASGTPLRRLDPLKSWSLASQYFKPPAISFDGRRLAAAYASSLVVWDLAAGQPLTDPMGVWRRSAKGRFFKGELEFRLCNSQ